MVLCVTTRAKEIADGSSADDGGDGGDGPGAVEVAGETQAKHAEMLGGAVQSLRRNDETLRRLATAFQGAGNESYMVGRSVRDAMLARLSHDLDFTTDARPDVVLGILEPMAETVWDTGIEFGTVSALFGGLEVEITTFRA